MAGGIVSALVSISNDTSLISPIVEEQTVMQTRSLISALQSVPAGNHVNGHAVFL